MGAGGRVLTGAEVLRDEGWRRVRGVKLGVVTNPTAVVGPDLRHVVDVMDESMGVDVVAVFGPEHGFRGTAQAGFSEDGQEALASDPTTGLPVYDIYMKSGAGLRRVLQQSGAEAVVFDICDVGARFYTFIWTLYDVLEACHALGLPVLVLDRPNPIGGLAMGGPLMQREHASFVGRRAIPIRHGMTAGELALLFHAEFITPAAADGDGEAGPRKAAAPKGTKRPASKLPPVSVVPCRGWSRKMLWSETGLPWVPPSPNMPTPATALAYVGTGLFEAVTASEGRGTCTPFELVGAPGVDHRLAAQLRRLGLPGVAFREAYFNPTFSKHQGTLCGGVQLFVTDPGAFDPLRTALAILVALRRLFPEAFAWREAKAPYWMDQLTGTSDARTIIDAGGTADQVLAAWEPDRIAFALMRMPYLLKEYT